MPITLPNLDDVTWEEFNEEARSLIPGYAPDWTNFNPSDPGITVLELLAHFSEVLLYRTNQITDEQVELFLRLLNGPEWRPRKSLDQEQHETLASLAQPRRAVTAADFEALAISATETSTDLRTPFTLANRVARAKCLAGRNLAPEGEDSIDAKAPGHVSVVVVTHENPVPGAITLRRVKQVLDRARLITTRVHVVPPTFVPFGVRLTLVVTDEASLDWVRTAAMNRLEDFFDPLRGGFDERGWPFGRNVYVSELYQLMSRIPGVDYVAESREGSGGEEQDEIVVDSAAEFRKQFNGANELEALEIRDYELVRLQLGPNDLVVRRKGRSR